MEEACRATYYVTGMAHSIVGGSAWETLNKESRR